MADVTDILTNDDGDILFSNGDISWGNGTNQHQRDIIVVNKGELKHAPGTGVGANDYLNENDPAKLVRAIRKELTKDGQTIESFKVVDGDFEIDAKY